MSERLALLEESGVVAGVRGRLAGQADAGLGPVEIGRALAAQGRLLGSDGVLAAAPAVTAHVRGLGALQPLVDDPSVTDILVNGPLKIWVDRGQGLERIQARFSSEEEVRRLAQRLISLGGRRIDDARPCADVQLRGCRVHAVLPPVASRGTLISVRVARPRRTSLESFLGEGVQDEYARHVLEAVVRRRRNFLVSGGTGSGKTTLLGHLLGLVPEDERILLVEDAAELDPRHPHAVSLQSREANTEGEGELSVAELVRQALRMRPDRLVVGECRGAEVRELLTAMNTGHQGSGGTLHANSADAVPARLAALGALAGMDVSTTALYAASALDAVIHVRRDRGSRRIEQIGVFEASPDESGQPRMRVVPALVFHGGAWSAREGMERLEALCGF
ncbi:TadA family conjugal transfer-associated ATPase [Arthrobacter sp. UM1]|uniref:TadA family conjugal transfer-associated ATPase n=1 Tax=Arthrobacter sp. UM1 TaxID=2766776 RepID=UPI001CF70A3F|nr:TadA family conjugal transfer-associated ATPase [Arthrobacter sp. UM1]MCB4208985.1 TadA family conjugal transfer-associated ATPase [Arthrobacter sp. UM1]